MKKLKVKALIIDGNKIFPCKIYYDPKTRLAELKRFFRVKARFDIDPNHIKEMQTFKRQYVVFIDNSQRSSVEIPKIKKIVITEGNRKEIKTEEQKEAVEVIKSIDPVEDKSEINIVKATKLDYLIDLSFWRSVWAKRKLPLSTLIITLLAGMGIYHLLVLFLRACGINV